MAAGEGTRAAREEQGRVSTAPAMRVLIAIVHWNTPELLGECLDALAGISRDHVTLLVIDNASSTPLPAHAVLDHAATRVLRLPMNVGYAGASAHAAQMVIDDGFDALWLLNADVVVSAGALAALELASRTAPDAVIGCVVMDAAGTAPEMPEKFLHDDRRWRFGFRDGVTDAAWFGNEVRQVQSIHGAACWIPRGLLVRHGAFDASFFLYCEEIDYCLRLRRLGVPILVAGRARVRHAGSGSSARQPAVEAILDYYRTRNELVLWRRHAPMWLPWIAVRKFVRTTLASVRREPSSPWRWLGLFDGLKGRTGRRFAPEAAWQAEAPTGSN